MGVENLAEVHTAASLHKHSHPNLIHPFDIPPSCPDPCLEDLRAFLSFDCSFQVDGLPLTIIPNDLKFHIIALLRTHLNDKQVHMCVFGASAKKTIASGEVGSQ